MTDQSFFRNLADTMQRYAAAIVLPDSNEEPEWLLRDCLVELASSAEHLDLNGSCAITVGFIGEHFASLVKSSYNPSDVWRLLTYCARFAYERTMRSDAYGDLAGSLFRLFSLSNPKASAQHVAEYSLTLPAIANGVALEKVKEVEGRVNNANHRASESQAIIEKKMKELDGVIKSGDERIKTYKELVDRIVSHYNFMGLSEAFRMQAQASFKRKRSAFVCMLFTAALPVGGFLGAALFSVQHALVPNGQSVWTVLSERAVLSATAIVPTAFLLIYFFRIAYAQFKSAEAVQLQYEHRYSMCAFIEGYATTRATLPDVNMEKFEAMVFSGITPDAGNIPTTFDGMDVMLKLGEAIKGK